MLGVTCKAGPPRGYRPNTALAKPAAIISRPSSSSSTPRRRQPPRVQARAPGSSSMLAAPAVQPTSCSGSQSEGACRGEAGAGDACAEWPALPAFSQLATRHPTCKPHQPSHSPPGPGRTPPQAQRTAARAGGGPALLQPLVGQLRAWPAAEEAAGPAHVRAAPASAAALPPAGPARAAGALPAPGQRPAGVGRAAGPCTRVCSHLARQGVPLAVSRQNSACLTSP